MPCIFFPLLCSCVSVCREQDMPSQMRCDVFLTRIICVFLAFIYGLKCWMERKGTNRALTNTVLNERGRRKSTRDVFNAFYFEFRVACLCCLFKVLCVVFSIYVHIYENEAKAKQHEKKIEEKRNKQKGKKNIARAINRIETSKIIRSAQSFAFEKQKSSTFRCKYTTKPKQTMLEHCAMP